MRCAQCGPTADATTLSTHHTSEGLVRYQKCACGAMSIEMLTIPVEPVRVFPAGPGAVAEASGVRIRDLHAVRA
ncbi:hypothetical protein ACL02T_05595 [Pseudonocardia sp. RS010]|uniref:hypothetical protein n=1 Tax=Pseudonocardia sp. RS010 TaxID=3385979 RepID=UPI0039A0021C